MVMNQSRFPLNVPITICFVVCIPWSDGVFKLLGAILPASNFLGLVLRVPGSGFECQAI